MRRLYPFVHMLSADYEEQCVANYWKIIPRILRLPKSIFRSIMTLIRGVGSTHPCPVCLVPEDSQSQLQTDWPRRKAEDAQTVVWNKSLNLSQKDELLKTKGLRNIEVRAYLCCYCSKLMSLTFAFAECVLDCGKLRSP